VFWGPYSGVRQVITSGGSGYFSRREGRNGKITMANFSKDGNSRRKSQRAIIISRDGKNAVKCNNAVSRRDKNDNFRCYAASAAEDLLYIQCSINKVKVTEKNHATLRG
jgi:hypothetical protein